MSTPYPRPLAAVFNAANRLVVPLLRSPVHRLASGKLMVVSYTGAKSGRSFALPVAYYAFSPDEVWAFGARTGWMTNFRLPRPASLRLRGRDLRAEGLLVDDRVEVADLIIELVERGVTSAAQDPFLSLPKGRTPTRDEAGAAADRARIVRFALDEQL
ncbi:hypothetical protein [Tomitella fengzijianii]|uniref:Deazaflavin-dependent oxidoreductase, nitroreductase family n=1 Tax=Tomitella fengzijianii TaxID=2597660 RepID=A0A516X6T9_9ACTN|nr:hypothetical protein [Tomitella fengzijianii]QDQ98775.1 hypothetical protein FO059_17330 [Tomitella fengzijianii]